MVVLRKFIMLAMFFNAIKKHNIDKTPYLWDLLTSQQLSKAEVINL